jgi:hypothetical protein
MHKVYYCLFSTSLRRILGQSLVIATVGLISSNFGWSEQAHAQTLTINNTEVTNYAKAVLAMEKPRQQAFDQIKKEIGNGEIPKIVCNDPKSINNLPDKARDIAIKYCNHSQKIVEDNGFTIDRFNKITIELQNNDNLKQQVYNMLLRLQKKTESR